MTDITRQLAEFAGNLAYDAIPERVSEKTRALVFDQFGIAMRARQEAALSEPTLEALRDLDLATGTATVVGDSSRYSAMGAAFFNASLGHALDFDDTHAQGSIHPSAPIVWAAIAAGELTGASGKELIAAITAGYEIQIRLSLALVPADHYRRGFHPTATCGVFGATAAAGKVLGLDVPTLQSALGLCGSLSAGSMQYIADGSWNKPFHVGYAAMNGLVSAQFAKRGYIGSHRIVEGEFGFLKAYADNPNPGAATAGLGSRWHTTDIALKPYPSCRYGHAAIDALLALRTDTGLSAEQVETVEIGLPSTGWTIIGNPDEEKQRPGTVVEGQFSMPFVAAVALRDGGMTWDSYEKHLADPDTRALCRRITTVTDPDAEAQFPRYMAAVARVTTRDGQTLEHKVTIAKGEPENFLSSLELRAKFDGLISNYLPATVRDALADALLGLDQIADARQLMALVQPDNFAATVPGTFIHRPSPSEPATPSGSAH